MSLSWNNLSSEIQNLFDFSQYSRNEYIPAIQSAIASIYFDSVGQTEIDALLSESQESGASFEKIVFLYTAGDAVTLGPSNQPSNFVKIGPNPMFGFINDNGQFVQYTLVRALFHELWHSIVKGNDTSYTFGSQNVSPNFLTGPTVEEENAFAMNYYGSRLEGSQRSSYLAGIPSFYAQKNVGNGAVATMQ